MHIGKWGEFLESPRLKTWVLAADTLAKRCWRIDLRRVLSSILSVLAFAGALVVILLLVSFIATEEGSSEVAREGQVAVLAEAALSSTSALRNASAQALIFIALFLAMDEQADQAISVLQRAYDQGFRDHGYLAYMPPYDPIRNDPRFVEILRMIRADTQKMRERVDSVRDNGDWESLLARFSPQQTASR